MVELQCTANPGATAGGGIAQVLAVRLAAHGYRVTFPSDRGPAVFKLTGLPGDPDVEVTVGDGGPSAYRYPNSNLAEAAAVTTRLPSPGAAVRGAAGEAAAAARDGLEIEWHYLALPGQPIGEEQVPAALLAHLSVLAGWSGGRDAALVAGASRG